MLVVRDHLKMVAWATMVSNVVEIRERGGDETSFSCWSGSGPLHKELIWMGLHRHQESAGWGRIRENGTRTRMSAVV